MTRVTYKLNDNGLLFLALLSQLNTFVKYPACPGVGMAPVSVHCDMRGAGGLTRVGHNLQGEQQVAKGIKEKENI